MVVLLKKFTLFTNLTPSRILDSFFLSEPLESHFVLKNSDINNYLTTAILQTFYSLYLRWP